MHACCGPVKPDVVLFGELLPEAAMAEAQQLAAGADLMLCVGSSLEVYPVAGLPAVTLAPAADRDRHQGPDAVRRRAEVKLAGDVVEELAAVLAAL